jgi:serine/threonine protein kinase
MQLVSVLDYPHNVQKVAHRDLELENILLDSFDNIRVIDFGLSRTFSEEQDAFTTPCGSPAYLSPELITDGKCTMATDIWSLGVVMYGCATGRFPFFHENMAILCRLITTRDVYYPMTLSDELTDLLQRMLCRNPDERITINQIKRHPWFPAEQYASFRKLYDLEDPMTVDEEVLGMMEGNAINCTNLEQEIASGTDTDLTVLYKIYHRQKQGTAINTILRRRMANHIAPEGQVSLPAMRPEPPTSFTSALSHHSPEQRKKPSRARWSDERPQVFAGGQRRLRRPPVLPLHARLSPCPPRPAEKMPSITPEMVLAGP